MKYLTQTGRALLLVLGAVLAIVGITLWSCWPAPAAPPLCVAELALIPTVRDAYLCGQLHATEHDLHVTAPRDVGEHCDVYRPWDPFAGE